MNCLALALALAQLQAPATATPPAALETAYDAGMRGRWRDEGWGRRDTESGRPARLDFSALGGWRLMHSHLAGSYTDLTFTLWAPTTFGDFLEVQLGAGGGADEASFARVRVDDAHSRRAAGGARLVHISMAALNPQRLQFDRIEFRAHRQVSSDWAMIDKVILWGLQELNAGRAQAASWREARLSIDCRQRTHPISPLIYGTAYDPQHNDPGQWHSRPSARRWGGNTSSRYNWQLGNAWNLAVDWFFQNANVTGRPDYSWESFLEENRRARVGTTITVPMIGWVAKDTTGYSYPVSVFGPQRRAIGPTQNIGDGVLASGAKVAGADPGRTSVPASPLFVGRWVEAIERWHNAQPDAQRPSYILDNEPSLWNSTHRDVHPQAVTYDELLQRTIAYGREVRRAAPRAAIAGPAEWGWPSYFFSALDAERGFSTKPDRRAHGDQPLLAWYLRRLAQHEEETGEKLLNLLDVHYYPQSDGSFGQGERTDEASNQRRVRATRSLWDPAYLDESWIADRVQLLPRLRRLIEANYPGLELSLGEYNFGGENHVSGGVAQAEVLGRLGQAGVHSAYYWTYPPARSPVAWAFAAYRNYDGQGRGFLGESLATHGDANTSVFASRDPSRSVVVAVLVNLDPHQGTQATVALNGCGATRQVRLFQYAGEPEGLHAIAGVGADAKPVAAAPAPAGVVVQLPPWSITVAEIVVWADGASPPIR